ncbi:hypothetical protein [Psychrobacter sp. I-STPA6b]|uniref:hypothetical protein n=1 Tax=Psychrobacter sp. I-STPA6b TaxID=2585718 RepID=UPI001D0C63F3|nr:hypothetical protein [Psychrobacter sp. I-STPA6b]
MQSSYQKQYRFSFAKLSHLSKLSVLATSIAMASMLTATSAQAVTGLRAGAPITGNITTSSPRDESDNTPYQLYLYQGVPGERVLFELKSDDFDPYLIVGSDAKNDPYCDDCKSDDDGGDELNSRLFYVIPEGGNAYIRAGMIDTEYGRYTLEAKRLPPARTSSPQNLTTRSNRTAQLQQNSATDDDGKYYQLYRISGQPNAFVNVKMTSDDIDSYLELVDSDLDRIDYDDDSLDDSNARLKVQLDARGQALIKATSYDPLETGSYTISTQPLNAVLVVNPTKTIRVGTATQGELRTNQPLYEGDYYFDAYRIQGQPGQRVQVNLDSNDFDAYLRWGYNANGKFNTSLENDDVNEDSDDYDAEDSNSQLTITLDRDGKGVLMVTTYDPEESGKYRLSVIESKLP